MSWEIKEKIKKILTEEDGYYIYPIGSRIRFALVYPNSYFVGMSNLGIHIIYKELNERKDIACERFFLPDKKDMDLYEKTKTPLLSIETQDPLYKFPLIGFSISFEMDYFNVLKILSMGKVKLLSKDRNEMDPIVIAGGPCATFNPEPLTNFFDLFVIGEGEETVHNIVNTYQAGTDKNLTRDEILFNMAHIPGVYVPKFYDHIYDENNHLKEIIPQCDVPNKVRRQYVKDIDKYTGHTVITTDNTEFNLFLLETSRGCGRHCRFCMAGYCFRNPRNRSLKTLIEQIPVAKAKNKKIGLMGPAISDYPHINELCIAIKKANLPMSVASFRADSVTKELVDALASSGQKSLTLAPEAGSTKIRNVINKGIEEKHLFNSIKLGIEHGIKNFRLYIMVGLPKEEMEDVVAIVDMTKRLKKYMDDLGSKGTLTLSINPFITKPFTPFQWLKMQDLKTVEKYFKYIRSELKKDKEIEVLFESTKEAYIQGVLARGDRNISNALLMAHQKGGSKAFKSALKELGINGEDYIYKDIDEHRILPWDIIDMGFQKAYLYDELQRSLEEKFTPQCFEGCKRCGVCG